MNATSIPPLAPVIRSQVTPLESGARKTIPRSSARA